MNIMYRACLKAFHEESVYCKVQRWSIWLQQRTGFEARAHKAAYKNTLAIHYLQRGLFRSYPSDFPKNGIGGPIERFLCIVKWALEHTRERTIYTPRYLSSSTHIILSPDDIQTGVQSALLLGPILTQHDLLGFRLSRLPCQLQQVPAHIFLTDSKADIQRRLITEYYLHTE